MDRPDARRALRVHLGTMGLAGALAGAFLGWVAAVRVVDFDEGYYGLAARLVFEGRVLYRDLFYPQAPLFPYVYGGWMQAFGTSLYASRSLSVVCAALLSILVCRHAVERFGSAWLAALAVAALLADRSVLEWYATAKTYALSTLCLFAAYQLVDRPTSERTPRRWLFAGLLLGLAIEVRLLFAAVLPVFAVLAWRLPDPCRRQSLTRWAAGLALAGLPALALAAIAPAQFAFDNIGWARFRSDDGFIGGLPQKAHVLSRVVGLPQYAGLVAAAAAAVSWRLCRGRLPPVACWLALSLAAASVLPTPTYAQYFCTTVPFLLFTALELVPLASEGSDRWQPLRRRGVLAGVTVAMLVSVLVGVRSAVALQRLSTSRGPFDELTMAAVHELADLLDAHTVPGERVLSFRPLYVFLSHTEPIAGFENDVAPVVAQIGGFSAGEVHGLGLIRNDEIEAMIASREVRIIVSPIDTTGFYGRAGRPWDRLVRDAGYEPIETHRGVTIWARPA
jgi:4-amino-4-deoxy-L-arabinose transferase-like glycosyltransferase